MPRVPVESRVSVNGVEIALWEWPGQGSPVFFCHATGFHARVWDQVIKHFPERRCYAFDARGHGCSSKPAPPYPWRNFGADVAAVAKSLGLSGAIGVGHSLGGHAVTLGAALTLDSVPSSSAFSALLLIDPVIRSKNHYAAPWKKAQFVARRRNRWTSPQEMFESFAAHPAFDLWDRDVLRDYCRYGLTPDGQDYILACPPEIEASIYEEGAAVESNIYSEIATIPIPVHVVRAGRFQDPANVMRASPTAPELAASFARGTDTLLTEHSHLIPMESPELAAKLITDISTLL